MKKVLLIDTNFIFGGGQYMILRLLDSMHNFFIPIVIYSNQNKKMEIELKKRNVRSFSFSVLNLKTEKKLFKFFRQIPNFFILMVKTFIIIKKEKPDIVFVNLFYSAFFSFFPSRLLRKKILLNIYIKENILKYKFFSRFIFNRFSLVIFPTFELFNLAKKIGVKENKLKVVRVGIDIQNFFPVKEKNIKLPLSVGMIARFDKDQKGHDVFLRAAQIAQENKVPVNFFIIGGSIEKTEQDYEDYLKQYVKEQKMEELVFFKGFCPNLIEALSSLDVVVVPSFYESIPAVIPEAFAMNIPVIASNVGGMPEIVSHKKNGFLFSVGNYNELYDFILFFLNNPEEIYKMGKEGRRLVESDFSFKKMSNQYKEIFLSLCE